MCLEISALEKGEVQIYAFGCPVCKKRFFPDAAHLYY